MHVALIGLCAPRDLVDLLDQGSALRALQAQCYRAMPVSDLARALLRRGHQVTVLTTTFEPDQAADEFTGTRLRVVMTKGRPRPRHHLSDLYRQERRELASYLRDARPDLVHAHWTYEYELAAQDSGLLHVTTAHDSPPTITRQVPDLYRVARLAVAIRARRGIRHLSAVSGYLARRWRSEMLYRRPIAVIPNWIPNDIPRGAWTLQEPPAVLDVADDSPRKNIRLLLVAFHLVRQQMPGVRLHLVGRGLQSTGRVAEWARLQGWDQDVEFIGPLDRPEVAEQFLSATVLAHASLEESCPMVLLEALGTGLPVVGGAVSGGVPFVLGEGSRGVLTDVRDSAAFAADLLRVLQNPLDHTVSQDSLREFEESTVVDQYLSWYERVLNC